MTTRLLTAVFILAMLTVPAAADTTFQGTLYYTLWCCGGTNVFSINFNYNQTTHTACLGAPNGIAAVAGADGIIFAPNGNLLIGGQGIPAVHEITTGGAFVRDLTTNGSASFHLALNPNGQTVYTSNFNGPLVSINLNTNTASVNGIAGTVSGGLTQVAFAPNGNVFYVEGNPNGGGRVGLLDLNTFVGTPLFGNQPITPAHGLIYDPYTTLMTLFGAGYVGTFTTLGTNLLVGGPFHCDFDQGAVDGQGHALVAGCNSITFIDYALSHDITNPDYVTSFGGFYYIDDVAPLVGPGSQEGTVPEPASLVLLGSGLLGLGSRLRRRKL